MILKLEDTVFNVGLRYEYINSDHITKIVIKRKRIRLYLLGGGYIFVGRTKYNMEQLHKAYPDISFKW